MSRKETLKSESVELIEIPIVRSFGSLLIPKLPSKYTLCVGVSPSDGACGSQLRFTVFERFHSHHNRRHNAPGSHSSLLTLNLKSLGVRFSLICRSRSPSTTVSLYKRNQKSSQHYH